MKEERRLRVSVVVCVHDEELLLGQCLESLLSQDAPSDRYEVIVVDDESTDRSAVIAGGYVRKASERTVQMKLVHMHRGGLSAARNAGIEQSEGDLVAFIDGDAVASRNWVSRIIDAFVSCPELMVVGGAVESMENASGFERFIQRAYYEPVLQGKSAAVVGTNMAFRRTFFHEYGGFFNYFDRRGDEVSLLVDAMRRRPNLKIAWNERIKVRHQHPASWLSWCRELRLNGRLTWVIDEFIDRARSKHYVRTLALIKLLSALYALILVGALLGAIPSPLFIILSAGWLIRQAALWRMLRVSVAKGSDHNAVVGGMAAGLTFLIGIANADWGYGTAIFHSRFRRPPSLERTAGKVREVAEA